MVAQATERTLGAPPTLAQPPPLAVFVVCVVVLMRLRLPTLGVSLLCVLAFESFVRRCGQEASRWLGLMLKERRIAADSI